MLLAPFVFGLFGLIVGSFLNVLVLRQGERPLSGRSSCMSCGTVIRWYDLVPVISWIFLRGRCRDCGTSISVQYPLVEAGTGVIFALIGAAPIILSFKLLALPIATLLIAIAVHDLRTTIIPDAWVATFGVFSLVAVVLSALNGASSLTWALLAGPVVAFPLFALWYVSGGRWMGLGDPKLALPIGWLLGFSGGFSAVFLAFILGAMVGVPLLFFSSDRWKRAARRLIPSVAFSGGRLGFTMKSEVAFGPFLVLGCFIVWFSQMYNVPLPFLW